MNRGTPPQVEIITNQMLQTILNLVRTQNQPRFESHAVTNLRDDNVQFAHFMQANHPTIRLNVNCYCCVRNEAANELISTLAPTRCVRPTCLIPETVNNK
jgi:hypothetical protein